MLKIFRQPEKLILSRNFGAVFFLLLNFCFEKIFGYFENFGLGGFVKKLKLKKWVCDVKRNKVKTRARVTVFGSLDNSGFEGYKCS
uniref:Uncharacterized protein n=1 Tax=Kingella kingae KKC2005004457 TaxID=1229911 RepID=T0L4E6_KINKI|nr:hypothetical protein C297_p00245 [Kingella kingae KKC2005004457]